MSVGVESSVKECRICGEVKQIVAFHTYKDRKGFKRRFGICKKCRESGIQNENDKRREWRKEYNTNTRSQRSLKNAERRAVGKKFVDEYKSARPCADCGKSWPPVAMDLDHVRGDKSGNIAGFVSGAYKLDLIKLELEKCEVVCACCHRLRTADRKQNRCFPPRSIAPKKETKSLAVRMVEFQGETRSVKDWCDKLSIPYKRVAHRLWRGYPVEDAFNPNRLTYATSPIKNARRKSEFYARKLSHGIAQCIREDRASGMTQQKIADKYSVTQSTISSILLGKIWRPEELAAS